MTKPKPSVEGAIEEMFTGEWKFWKSMLAALTTLTPVLLAVIVGAMSYIGAIRDLATDTAAKVLVLTAHFEGSESAKNQRDATQDKALADALARIEGQYQAINRTQEILLLRIGAPRTQQ